MKYSYETALTVGVLFALIAASASVKAQTVEAEKAPLPPAATNVGLVTAKGVNDALKATYINTCLPDCETFAVGAGDAVALDAVTTIDCPASAGKTCTITDDAWIELENTSTTTNNPEALGFYLDSVDADVYYDGGGGTPGGPFYDAIAHKTAVATGVSPGTHTVQTYTYSVDGANAIAWTATYRVFVP